MALKSPALAPGSSTSTTWEAQLKQDSRYFLLNAAFFLSAALEFPTVSSLGPHFQKSSPAMFVLLLCLNSFFTFTMFFILAGVSLWAYQKRSWDKYAVGKRGTGRSDKWDNGQASYRLKWVSDSDFKPAIRSSLVVICHSLKGFGQESASSWFIMASVQSDLAVTDNLYLQPLPSTGSTASAPPQVTRH